MKIILENVVVHNFLSYGHAQISLRDKHYCLVSGVNNDTRDKAKSNGSGKSTWSSAICWALTGETIQGLKSNIKNINVAEDSCYVELTFKVDSDTYKVKRIKAPKSDLRIELNGEDISGKGIKESEVILKNRIPDLTSELIGSIIILGQGLPCKFTANTPSGRKEVLEKLSQSDYMIEDLKTKITSRLGVLSANIRTTENDLLVTNTKVQSNEEAINKLKDKIKSLQITRDYDSEIAALNKKVKEIEAANNKIDEDIKTKNNEYTEITDRISVINSKKTDDLNDETIDFNLYYQRYLSSKSTYESSIKSLNNEIQKKKSITDVCPTCGQKIPGVIKPSTQDEENKIIEFNNNLKTLNEEYTSNSAKHQAALNKINNECQLKLNDLNAALQSIRSDLAVLHSSKNNDLMLYQTQLNTLQLEQSTRLNNLREAEEELRTKEISGQELQDSIKALTLSLEDLQKHLSVVNQMNTLVKRDFRGYLLAGIIEYICKKSKEYAVEVFGTEDLRFELDGNNIEISYANKAFENLSGGEKQRVDLVIQLAIRDMMQTYLGFSSNILVLDEVFDNLDKLATDNIISLITNKLNDVESVFIISHHANELNIPYDCEMIVTKNKEGVSTIRWA